MQANTQNFTHWQNKTDVRETPVHPLFLVPLGVEINPRFYRGKKNERSYNKAGELDASPKRL